MSNCLVPTQQPTISNYNDRIAKLEKKLSESNALIAMVKENIAEFHADKVREEDAIKNIECALSASPASLSAWEAEKLEPLQRQVAMLRDALQDAVEEYKKLPHSLGYTITHGQRWERMISNTQATAEAFLNEYAAK